LNLSRLGEENTEFLLVLMIEGIKSREERLQKEIFRLERQDKDNGEVIMRYGETIKELKEKLRIAGIE
jgi:predicted RNA-binding protein YlqC (UPF0109 family)